MGKVLLQDYKLEKGINKLNLEHWAPGIYYLLLQDSETRVSKFIIQ